MERAGVSAAQNGGSGSSGVVEMVSKAGHLTSEAQPQGGGLEGGRLGRGHSAREELFSLFTTGNVGLSKVYGSTVKILRCSPFGSVMENEP